tara:strand:+ start:3299 stop:4336 length:1038 start_codon:yes stop_codon:yes gene_type:complete
MVKKRSKRSKKATHLMTPYVKFYGATAMLFNEHLKDKKDRSIIEGRPDFTDEFNSNTAMAKNDSENKRMYLGILKRLEQAKYFEVDKDLSEHLERTKPLDVSQSNDFQMPFDRMFISTSIKHENSIISGMLVCKKSIRMEIGDDGPELKYLPSGTNATRESSIEHSIDGYEVNYRIDFDNGNYYINNSFIIFTHNEIKEIYGVDADTSFIKNETHTTVVKNYLINLVCFLTLKEKVLIERNRTNSFKKRKKSGYIPIPSSTLITCDNKTKEYFAKYKEAVDSGAMGVTKHDRIAFWRKYRHRKYKHVPIITRPDGKVGKYQWIKPTIVGSGVYIPKHRRVKFSKD